jgi:hypothetical protein
MGDRWLGPRHAIRVKKNPLHYTTKIEDCIECIRCERWLHKMAYELPSGVRVRVCQECREELAKKRPRAGLP